MRKDAELSFPIPLRFLFASHPQLLAPILRIIHRVISTFLIQQAGLKRNQTHTGAVTLIQRFGSAANLNIHLPTGVDSSGIDVSLTGLVTKSFGRLRLHANAGYAFLSGEDPSERDGRYEITLGASYPIGASHYTRLTILGDLFTKQSVARGESNIGGAEVGLRYQLTCTVQYWMQASAPNSQDPRNDHGSSS
jgi:hypothetical protein